MAVEGLAGDAEFRRRGQRRQAVGVQRPFSNSGEPAPMGLPGGPLWVEPTASPARPAERLESAPCCPSPAKPSSTEFAPFRSFPDASPNLSGGGERTLGLWPYSPCDW
jgi:hypothetical protein